MLRGGGPTSNLRFSRLRCASARAAATAALGPAGVGSSGFAVAIGAAWQVLAYPEIWLGRMAALSLTACPSLAAGAAQTTPLPSGSLDVVAPCACASGAKARAGRMRNMRIGQSIGLLSALCSRADGTLRVKAIPFLGSAELVPSPLATLRRNAP